MPEHSRGHRSPTGGRKENYSGHDDHHHHRARRRSRHTRERSRQRYNDDDYDDGERAYTSRGEHSGRRREWTRDRRRSRSRDEVREMRSYRKRTRSLSDSRSRSLSRSRSRSQSRDHPHRRRRSRSPPRKAYRGSHSDSRSPQSRSRAPPPSPPARRSRAPLPSQDESFRGGGTDRPPLLDSDGKPIEKQKPNYKPTGLLAKEANTVAGTNTVLKYHEPAEARKPPPRDQWRMYVFKQKDLVDTVYLHQRSAWLLGRDRTVTDMLLEHPSISKQHAVIQFRHITKTNEFGDKLSKVKPYLIDLDSANGTKLNGKKVEASRYVELVDGDVLAFGDSEREYVIMLPPMDA